MTIWYRPGFVFSTVDPGLRGCGVAEFKGGELYRAAYIRNPVTSGRGYDAHSQLGGAVIDWISACSERVIIEHPIVYPSSNNIGDPNDLLDVVAVGAAVAAGFNAGYIETVFPREWKGQVPKDVMTERISRAITAEERPRIEKCQASLMHNVLDAVGIGLHKLNRLNTRKIYNE